MARAVEKTRDVALSNAFSLWFSSLIRSKSVLECNGIFFLELCKLDETNYKKTFKLNIKKIASIRYLESLPSKYYM